MKITFLLIIIILILFVINITLHGQQEMNKVWNPSTNSFITDTFINKSQSHIVHRDSIWQSIGPYNYDVLRCDFGENNPEIIYAATREYGVYKTIDGGENWNQINSGIDDNFIRSIAVHPQLSNIILAGTYHNGLYRSTNSGQTWEFVDSIQDTTIFDIKFDLQDENTVYVGTYTKGVYRSWDSGVSWQHLSPDSVSTAAFTIIIDPNNSNIVFYSNSDEDRVYKSTDYGQNWELFFEGIKIISFAIDPNNSDNIYMGLLDGPLYKTINGGQTWETILIDNHNEIITDILISPINSNIIYLSSAFGTVFRSDDWGLTWEDFSSGILASSVLQLKFQPYSTSTLFATTNGGAIYKIENFITSVSNYEIDNSNYFILSQNHPNPFNPTTTIEFSIQCDSEIELSIYNL